MKPADAAFVPRPSPPGAIPLTVVVPIGPGDTTWLTLLTLLSPDLGPGLELILSGTTPDPRDPAVADHYLPHPSIRWVHGATGRGRQLNLGAAAASGRFLWFLHADSRPVPGTIPRLLRLLSANGPALWYFDLRFLPDGPRWTRLNQAGAALRSRLLGLPFGDQGFVLSAELFQQIGRFDETTDYGEDHLLVWAARRSGVPVRPWGIPLYTSARKYRQGGWLRTTLRHLWRTARQALPQALRLLVHRGATGR